jgi:elongation factor G
MKIYSTKNIRNIAILGHGGSGKTTLVEAMAFNAGAIDRMGQVTEGNTISDYDQEEKNRSFSISASLVPLEFGGHKINAIDVPGYFDFISDAHSAMKVADAAIIVIDTLSGVEVGTEKAFELVKERNIPAIIVANKMDRENVSFSKLLDELKEYFGNKIVPFELPLGEGENLKGVMNVVDLKGRERKENRCFDVELTEEEKSSIAPYRELVMESVAQTSEALMEKYFEGEELTTAEIHGALRQGVFEGELVPVLCGSASLNIGVETLENMIIEYLPSPNDREGVVGINPATSEEIIRKCSENEPFSAIVFKTIADPYVGKLSLFKVKSGEITSGDAVVNSSNGEKEKVNHIYILRGNKQIEVETLEAGDIGALSKLQHTLTNDTLCSPDSLIVYEKIKFPQPVISMGIEPKSKGDEDKIGTGIHRLTEEDPSLTVTRNKETHQTVISGLGEMHLDVVAHKLHDKFGVEVDLTPLKVPYRETITTKSTAEGKHKKQSGGRGQFGHVWIDFEPLSDQDEKFEFVDKVVGGSVPRNFIPAVEKGLEDCLGKGILAGYPVTGIQATLYDGSFHAVDSDEMSFKMAASAAFKKGMKDAKPVLLEPIYHVDIIVPEQYMGDIMGDLNKKRGRIMGMEPTGRNKQQITAEVPLSEMFKYATELRSMTQARGEFSMSFVRYEEVPQMIAEKVIETANAE